MTEIIERLTTALADRYRIEKHIGEGGMATVYLAHDIKHDRNVALKVLRPELAALIGAERFLNEIKVTANLQHPHILPLHDSGDADGFLFYVMPYVAGESLRETIVREKQLGIEEAIEITTAVASALDYAHRHDVIHRDIKPENILMHDGQALVADFGIALAVSQAGGTRLTETGLSLGTPHYMSPEQAMGDRELDARSDVYSLGAMLYEMLAGDPPYTGSTAQAIVAKVITEKAPPVTAARDTVPSHVAASIHKALNKLPADRFHSAAEFAEALARPGLVPVSTPAAEKAAGHEAEVASRSRLMRPSLPWPVVLVLLAIAWFGARVLADGGSTSGQPVLLTARMAAQDQMSNTGRPYVAISRDGMLLAVVGIRGEEDQVFLRRLDEPDFRPLGGTEGAANPFFSPDGEWIAFTANDSIKKISVDGGAPIVLAAARWAGGTWTQDGSIIYTPSYQNGLWQISAAGGTGLQLTEPDTTSGELGHWYPQLLPGGKAILFTNFSTPIDRSRIAVYSFETGEIKTIVEGATYGRYLPTGHLLYQRGGAMLSVPFDLSGLQVRGQAEPVLQQIAVGGPNGLAAVAIAENGTLAYIPASVWYPDRFLMWVDRTGKEELVLEAPGLYSDPVLSPDGKRIALTIERGSRDVWVYDLARGVNDRLTSRPSEAFGPVWTADGSKVVYSAEEPQFDLFWRAADASAPEELLLTSPNDKQAGSIAPDGGVMLFHESSPDANLWSLQLDGSGERTPVINTPFGESAPTVSPDGRWLIYTSNQSGRSEIYVAPFPDVTTSRMRVSTDGAFGSRWTRGGREIVYRNGKKMMSATFDPATGDVGIPTVIFEGPYAYSNFSPDFDVTPDGQRFLMVKIPPKSAPREITVVLNWFEELKERMGR